jgi:hypothetical protein
MKVPPAKLIIIEFTMIGASLMPNPMPIPVGLTRDNEKKIKKIANFDLVWCCPHETPKDMTATASWIETPIIKLINVLSSFAIPRAIPSNIA